MKKIIGLAIIFIIGLLLRLVMIDKPEGLWNDEYVSYMISAKPLWSGFINGIKSQCHMPLYYIYLKMIMAIFGQNDIVLRLSSVLTGVLSIIVMYFVGCERDRQCGIFCAFFCSISSFLIYYSQEVRLYSLLFLLSALTLLFTLRLVKKPDLKNLVLFLVFNFLVLFTHTIGLVFVFFNLVYVSYKLFKTHKNIIIKMWAIITVLLLLIIPQIFLILFRKSFSQWWGIFTPAALGFLFTDYFSPVITNFTGSPQSFFYNFHSGFIIFALIPSSIAFAFMIRALFEKENRELFYVVLCSVIVLTIAAVSGKLIFVTKYSIEIYPILIYLVCSGVSAAANKVLRNTGILFFCILSLFFLTFSPFAANKLPRSEGHKIAADLIKNADLKNGDIIIIQYYTSDRFNKYFDFSPYKVISMNKANFPGYILPDTNYAAVYKNGKNLLRGRFSSAENYYFVNRLHKDVTLKENQSVLLLTLKSVAFYDEKSLQKIAQNDVYYAHTPLLFMVFSYLRNQTYNTLAKDYAITGVKSMGAWSVIKFTKLHN